jgi:two-component system, chemotaxis family, chemotaxis protein CheY
MTIPPNLRVMIVDDEPFMRRTIRAMLRRVGPCVASEAGNGEEALSLLAAERPDVILCDINMAPMSGTQFLHALRRHEDAGIRATAVVMLTVSADEATVRGIAPLGIQGYLVKPVSPKQITDRLNAIFRARPAASIGLTTPS